MRFIRLISKLLPYFIYKWLQELKNKGKKKKSFNPEICKINGGWLSGGLMLLDPSTTLGKVFIEGNFDLFIFNDLEKYKLDGKIFYDIGAFMGYHSLCFAKKGGTSTRVYSFEPHPDNLQRFQKNVDLNEVLKPRINIFPCALSDKINTGRLVSNNRLENGGTSESFINQTDEHTHLAEFEVELQTIDNLIFLNKINVPDFIKMDVEGHEMFVIKGAEKMLNNFNPVLYIEIHNVTNMFYVLNSLSELKYKITLLSVYSSERCFIKAEKLWRE